MKLLYNFILTDNSNLSHLLYNYVRLKDTETEKFFGKMIVILLSFFILRFFYDLREMNTFSELPRN